jgi:hypothetical protein
MPTAAIEQLFLRFSVRYQRGWTSLFPTAEAYRVARNEWALILAEVDAAGIERALQRCLAEFPTYPPKPAEFLVLTQPTPDELGLPSLEVAYRAASQRRWRFHPLVWQIVQVIGPWRFRSLPESEARACFAEHYHALVAQVAAGRQLHLPEKRAPRLTQKPSPVTAPGAARAHLARIKALLRRPTTQPNSTAED